MSWTWRRCHVHIAGPPVRPRVRKSPCRSIIVVAAVSLLALVVAAPASAESLSERRAAKEKADTVEVEVACGKLDKENCAVVVPEINAKTVSQNMR